MHSKDKKNLPKPPSNNEALDDDATIVDSDDSAEETRGSAPKWLHVPQVKLPTEEETNASYYHEEFKPEPSKYNAVDTKKRSKAKARQLALQAGLPSGSVVKKSTVRPKKVSRATASTPQEHAPTAHISSRRDKRYQREASSSWLFKFAAVLLLSLLLTFAYQHRASLEDFAQSLLQSLLQHARLHLADEDIASGISAVADMGDPDEAMQLPLTALECQDLMPRAERTSNVLELELEVQFAIAECYYLKGDFLRSYRLLQHHEPRLRDEALLLYTILLLKRRQFTAVRTFLHGKCASPSRESQYFPCLAKGLLQVMHTGNITFVTEPSVLRQQNPYNAVAWLLKALYHRNYEPGSEYLRQATVAGERSKRRVALSYVYETIMRFSYPRASVAQLKQLRTLADQKLHYEPDAASWWVHFLAELGSAHNKRQEVLRLLSGKENFVKMYDNLDHLDIIGVESIDTGHISALDNALDRITKYQQRTWSTAAQETMKFLQQWQTRLLVARGRYLEAARGLKSYARRYGKDYFYCFFLGVALMKMAGKSNSFNSSTALLQHSISLRDRWENNYAYAYALLKSSKAMPLAKHMHKLKSLAITPDRKKWLFLLRAEIKVSSGKHNAAISDLRAYIAKHPQSFTAHRLLAAAYLRANKQAEAIVVRKAYDRLQKRVPYYRTEEGRSSPLGAFALL